MTTKKKKLRLYLAHNFDDRFNFRKIEKQIEKTHKIELFNPFYDTDRNDVRELDLLGVKRDEIYSKMQQFNKDKCKDIVERDLEAIRMSDGILSIINESTIGTSMEIFFAARILRIPVYIITTTHKSHPWLIYLVRLSGGKIFKNVADFQLWLYSHGYGESHVI